MRTLPMPTLVPSAVLDLCIQGFEDASLNSRLQSIKPLLVAAAEVYERHASAHSLHLLTRVNSVGEVSKEELTGLYTHQMSEAVGSARSIYNQIRSSAPNNKCPLCGIGTVTVLDHHLPKSKYPDLSVCPANLVPACDFCNNAKRATYPKLAGQQTLHPYYDDFTKEQWIFAEVSRGKPPTITYKVCPPAHWTSLDRDRVKSHYNVVKLALNYASNANDELITLRDHLAGIWASKQGAGVHDYLSDEAARYAFRLNSWQHAMYQALARDTWFIGGGFSEI